MDVPSKTPSRIFESLGFEVARSMGRPQSDKKSRHGSERQEREGARPYGPQREIQAHEERLGDIELPTAHLDAHNFGSLVRPTTCRSAAMAVAMFAQDGRSRNADPGEVRAPRSAIDCCNGWLGGLLVADDVLPRYGVTLAEMFVSSLPGPPAVGLPVQYTRTRPNVSANTQNASRRAIRRRTDAITG